MMATGAGFFDDQGVWQHGEDDVDVLQSDRLNRGQESISEQFTLDRARLEAVEDALDDSGWITPTLISGWAVPASYYQDLQYRRIGSRIEFRGAATGATPADPLFTLPMGFRPGINSGDELYFAVISGSGAIPTMTRVVIRQTGVVRVETSTSPNFDTISFRTD